MLYVVPSIAREDMQGKPSWWALHDVAFTEFVLLLVHLSCVYLLHKPLNLADSTIGTDQMLLELKKSVPECMCTSVAGTLSRSMLWYGALNEPEGTLDICCKYDLCQKNSRTELIKYYLFSLQTIITLGLVNVVPMPIYPQFLPLLEVMEASRKSFIRDALSSPHESQQFGLLFYLYDASLAAAVSEGEQKEIALQQVCE